MYNAIYCEFLKLKKSNFYLVLVLLTCFFPVMLCLGWLGEGDVVTWNVYIGLVEEMGIIMINLTMYALICAYIYTREFSCNTAQTLFAYPIGRIKIFISKFIVITIMIVCVTFFQMLLTILGGLLLPHEALTREILLGHLRINFYTLIYQYAIIPIAIFIALLSKNVIMPMIYGGLLTVSNLFLLSSGNKIIVNYIPSFYPILILKNSLKTLGKGETSTKVIDNAGLILPNLSIGIAIFTFIIGISLCIIYYLKADID